MKECGINGFAQDWLSVEQGVERNSEQQSDTVETEQKLGELARCLFPCCSFPAPSRESRTWSKLSSTLQYIHSADTLQYHCERSSVSHQSLLYCHTARTIYQQNECISTNQLTAESIVIISNKKKKKNQLLLELKEAAEGVV